MSSGSGPGSKFGPWLQTCRTLAHSLGRDGFARFSNSLACHQEGCTCPGFLELEKGTLELKGFYHDDDDTTTTSN